MGRNKQKSRSKKTGWGGRRAGAGAPRKVELWQRIEAMLWLQRQHGLCLKAASQVVGISVSDFERLEPIISALDGEVNSLDMTLQGGIKNLLRAARSLFETSRLSHSDEQDAILPRSLAELYPGPENRNLRRSLRRKIDHSFEQLPDGNTPEAELIRREEVDEESDLPPSENTDVLDESRLLKTPALMAVLGYWRKRNAQERALHRGPTKVGENVGPSVQEKEMIEDKRCHCGDLPQPHFHCDRCGEVFTSGGILLVEGNSRSIQVFEQPASTELPDDPNFQPAFDESIQTDEFVVGRSPLRIVALCPKCKPPPPSRSPRSKKSIPGQ